jgi:hypothetical protein
VLKTFPLWIARTVTTGGGGGGGVYVHCNPGGLSIGTQHHFPPSLVAVHDGASATSVGALGAAVSTES